MPRPCKATQQQAEIGFYQRMNFPPLSLSPKVTKYRPVHKLAQNSGLYPQVCIVGQWPSQEIKPTIPRFTIPSCRALFIRTDPLSEVMDPTLLTSGVELNQDWRLPQVISCFSRWPQLSRCTSPWWQSMVGSWLVIARWRQGRRRHGQKTSRGEQQLKGTMKFDQSSTTCSWSTLVSNSLRLLDHWCHSQSKALVAPAVVGQTNI